MVMSQDQYEGWSHNMNIDNTSLMKVLYAGLTYKTPWSVECNSSADL
jgi:hypothetical protein